MQKIDFKKELKQYYSSTKKAFEVVDVPPFQFLMVDGSGDPNTTQEYQEAVEALYTLSYKLKFTSKKELERDYVVPPLEGLWWAEEMEVFTTQRDKNAWSWTMMIMQPEWITQEMFETATTLVHQSKVLPGLERARLEEYHEGLSVQILHLGSYDDEGPILHKLHHEFIPEHGYQMRGKHHEIYLSDPRRVEPVKLKTILRQPVSKAC
jgi:hypothetical protein